MASTAIADLGVAFFTGIDMAAMKLLKDPSAESSCLKMSLRVV